MIKAVEDFGNRKICVKYIFETQNVGKRPCGSTPQPTLLLP